MKVLLAGATGVIGRQLVTLLGDNGHSVIALAHSDRSISWLNEHGVAYFTCDVLDQDRLSRQVALAEPDIVVNQLTAIPGRISPRRIATEMAMTNKLRRDGTVNLMKAAVAGGATRFISQSIAFAYGPDGAGPAVESEPLFTDAPGGFAETVDALLALENTTLNTAGVGGAVLRYGYFYGPGTAYGPGGAIREDITRSRFPVVGDGAGVFSFVHVADAAQATMNCMSKDISGVFNIVDDNPAAVADWLPEMAEFLGARPPPRISGPVARLAAGPYGHHVMTRQRGASNEKARNQLEWVPQYPSWRDGSLADEGAG